MPNIKPFKCFVYESRRGKKVVGEFVCDRIENIVYDVNEYYGVSQNQTKIPYEMLDEYLNKNIGYGWHISELVIYDEPKELSEYYRFGDFDDEYCIGCPYEIMLENSPCENCDGSKKFLKKPPQSWCYVEGGILISIRPEWWDLITSGKKTIEVRKSYPKKYEVGR